MRIRPAIGRLAGTALLFAAVNLCAVAPAQPAVEPTLEAARQISLLSVDNSNPALAFSPDGTRLFAVWDGVVGGNRRIMMRERVAGEWLPTVVVDSNPSGDNSFPSIGVDSAGTPHVAWISGPPDNRKPMYARRLTRYPNSWFQQAIPFPEDSTVDGNCDYVNLQLDPDDQPWIVWQYGFGNVLSLACTRYGADGALTSEELTPGATSLNLYPELYFYPEPTVYWYLAQSDHFYLLGSRLDPESGNWTVALPDNFESLPTDNLPDLFRTSRGPLAAIWYDRMAIQDGTTADRIFLGVQNPESRGRGEVVDQQPNASNHSVAGTAPYGLIITSWVSENYQDGSNIYLGLGNSPDTLQSIRITDDSTRVSSNPKVAGSLDEAAVAWEEKAGAGSPSSEIVVRIADLTQ